MRGLLILASILISGVVFTAFGQPCPECRGPHGPGFKGMGMDGPMPMRHEMMHKRHMVKMMHEGGERATVRGRVVSIEPGSKGARLMVESESRLVPVILGPGWGRPDNERKVEKNDWVEIAGRRMMRGGQPVIMAGEIRIDDDDQVVVLRPERKEKMERVRPERMEKMERKRIQRHKAY